LGCFIAFFSQAQEKIQWTNPSFEDLRKCCTPPRGWDNCGNKTETPPDIQPGFFSVELPAFNGGAYVGLVVRDNGTYEAIGQELDKPLEAGKSYTFSIYLAKSRVYLSQSPKTKKPANYVTPAYFKVWGAIDQDDTEAQLLYVSQKTITSPDWEKYTIVLKPKKFTKYIIFEAAYFKDAPYLHEDEFFCGNILLDNLSPIVEIKE
jgi:hypothetical protein